MPSLAAYSILFFALCMIAGECWPRRANSLPWHRRWLTNLSLFAVQLGIHRLLAAGAVFAFAIRVDGTNTGLLNQFPVPPTVAFVVTFLAFDLFTFATHRVWHAVPWLWRLHAVHHSDVELDTTTHYRHHPLEAFIGTGFRLGFVWCLGPDPFALACAGAASHFNSLFTHSNIALPPALDRGLRWLLVTPDMHRIHHSMRREETDSNFGNLLSCWDRLCGCYVSEPAGGQTGFELGLAQYRTPQTLTLWGQLKGPFVRNSTAVSVNPLVEVR